MAVHPERCDALIRHPSGVSGTQEEHVIMARPENTCFRSFRSTCNSYINEASHEDEGELVVGEVVQRHLRDLPLRPL